MATQTFYIFTCPVANQSSRVQLATTNEKYGTCTAGTGVWQKIDVEVLPQVDIVNTSVVIGCCVLIILGFIAGQQR